MNAKNPIRHLSFRHSVLIALPLAAVGLPGVAFSAVAADLPRVEVRAPAVSAYAVCPALEEKLRQALARVAMKHREPGLLEVNFEIDGPLIAEVGVAGYPFEYRRATRTAVRSLACDNGGAGRQTVRMQVVFKDL